MIYRPTIRSTRTLTGDRMAQNFTPEQHDDLAKHFTATISARSIADLRHLAKLWGWPVKGTAKASVVADIAARLCDPGTMSLAFAALPETERHALAWIAALPAHQGMERSLAAVLTQSTGVAVSEAEAASLVHDLYARGLLQLALTGIYEVPAILGEWLPEIRPVGLLYEKPVDAVPSLSAAALSLHIDNLLYMVETEKPPVVSTPHSQRSFDSREVVVGSGPVSRETLRHWGYESDEEQHLARFLLTALVAARLFQVSLHATPPRLEPQADAIAAWQSLAPFDQQALLTRVWVGQLSSPQAVVPAGIAWSEIELALEFHRHKRTGIEMQRVSQYYGSFTPSSKLISRPLLLVAATLTLLKTDTWYSFERYCQTLRAYAPTLGGPTPPGDSLLFVSGKRILDAASMEPGAWMNAYGSLAAAWLTGPARWLGRAEIAVKDRQVVAFRRPEKTRATAPVALPGDALHTLSGDRLVLRTIWQAGELRDLVRQVASPVARDRKTITYRLDPGAYRTALQRGVTADQIVTAFAIRGFPLPAGMQERIRLWESRAGRFQIYDNLAAIEFGDELAQREVESAAGLSQRQAYAVSNRCSLLLEPSSAAELVEALQRRGYIPKVLS